MGKWMWECGHMYQKLDRNVCKLTTRMDMTDMSAVALYDLYLFFFGSYRKWFNHLTKMKYEEYHAYARVNGYNFFLFMWKDKQVFSHSPGPLSLNSDNKK